MWRGSILLLVFGFCAMESIHAQTVPHGAEDAASGYLLRLERTRYLESTCVLLNANGKYHLERHVPRKVSVFEGNVSDAEFHDIVRIISGDLLFHLQQKQIPDLMLKSDNERVIVEIHRPGVWQQLLFPDSASREPFRDAIEPLVKWLDSVNKRKGRKFSEEEGRNNCLPPSTTEFAKRPAPRLDESHGTHPANDPLTLGEAPANPQAPYTLLMYETRRVAYGPHVSCLLVSAAGEFHMVTQTKTYDKPLSTAVLDGTLKEPQLAALRTILDAPELASQPEEEDQGEIMMTADGFFTRLFIPRGPVTQKLAAWKSYRIVNQVLSRSVEDHGTKVLTPLREWLKSNIDEKAAVPTPIPPNPRCTPGQ